MTRTNKLVKKAIPSILTLFLAANCCYAQSCPAGIPSAGNPMCLPPDRPESPYYNGSGAYVQQPVQPQIILIKRQWVDRWGAIAVDAEAGSLGFVTGLKNKEEAQLAALNDCKRKGGGACEINLSFFNQCAVFVTGKKFYSSQGAPTIEKAKNLALKRCSSKTTNCRIYQSACSMSELEPG